jgi:hypothetical protein
MRTTIKILCICGAILLMFSPLLYSSLSGAESPIETSSAQ